ncbi:cytochrome P450 [Bradyrhizobium sp. Arg237L]|uniref:cytochrome P450 n=1 Tax=Bradyrhizobium sp. Arg237L TaxID=3003352 RepID=UPI00249E7362|nr:cytochrome P450 [Bradyrhizobium sp. Arg237L]MDI4236217.1 cytochrome P450 [Bradyrhizobium sp. Arg237L]
MRAENSAKNLSVGPAIGEIPMLTVEELEADTHGVFRTYRKEYPVVLHETGGYFVLRFSDVDRLSKDPRFLPSGTSFPEIQGFSSGTIFDAFDYGMLTADGDVHRRRRAPFSRLFAARAINEMRPSIRRAASDLIEEWYGDGEVNFFEEFAAKLPARIIADLLGLPREDIPEFMLLVYVVSKVFFLGLSPDEVVEVEKAGQRLREYVDKVLDERRRGPRGDFLSAFLAAATEAGEMSPEEMLYQIFQLIVGGTDTTRVAIAVQVALLLQHREQWEQVCRDPDLVSGAVAEAMRFEPSVGGTARVTSEDVDVGGTVIPAGQLVTLSTMSAMRDEMTYDRPDIFDIHRTNQPRLHPIFGYGAHRCIGEAIARAELEESLSAIAARIPQLNLDVAPKISGHFGIRRADTMRLSWKP